MSLPCYETGFILFTSLKYPFIHDQDIRQINDACLFSCSRSAWDVMEVN